MLKALLINYNRLLLPVKMADWLFAHGIDPVFIDNDSDYAPLLDYYATTYYKVIRLNSNYGHTCIWNPLLNILDRAGVDGRYIVSDPDLDLSAVPGDFIYILNKGLDKYPVDKCALSLEISDLPDTPEGNFIRHHEAKYWKHPLDSQFFSADTDTTFALYRENVTLYSHSAIRTNRPYTCKHLPWYYDDLSQLPEDEQYYFKTANDSSSGKKRLVK